MIPVILFFSAIAAHGGLVDNIDTGKQSKKEVSKAVKKEAQTASQPLDGAAAFRQLPEEIQNRIIYEAARAKARGNCQTGNYFTFLRFKCDCVEEEFIKIRTIQGPEPTFDTILEESLKRCILTEPIAQHYYDNCLKSQDRNDKKFYSYCKCFSETMTNKIAEHPRLSSYLESEYHKETYAECGGGNNFK